MGWGSFFGAVTNSLDGMRDTAINYWLSDNYAKHQSKQWRSDQAWLLSNANQLKVRDLRAAGLNPVLAVQSGGGVATAPVTGVNSTHKGGSTAEAVSKIAAATSAKAQARLTDEEVKTQKSVQDVNNANAAKATADAEKAKADTVMTVAKNEHFQELPSIAKERILINMLNPSSHNNGNSARYYYGKKGTLERIADRIDENIILQAINGYSEAGESIGKIYDMLKDKFNAWRQQRNAERYDGNGGRNSAKSLSDIYREHMEWREKYNDYWDKKRKSGKAFDVIWRNGKPYYEDGREFK